VGLCVHVSVCVCVCVCVCVKSSVCFLTNLNQNRKSYQDFSFLSVRESSLCSK
jgi:hypothetical protein